MFEFKKLYVVQTLRPLHGIVMQLNIMKTYSTRVGGGRRGRIFCSYKVVVTESLKVIVPYLQVAERIQSATTQRNWTVDNRNGENGRT